MTLFCLMKSISVVIETVNLELGPRLDLPRVIAALETQTYPRDKIEIIVVVETGNTALRTFVRDTYPGVRIVDSADGATYYEMKNDGARIATGDIIVMLDSDCVPCPRWAESMVARLENGADAVGGKTRYEEGVLFSRTFNFFNFGYIQNDSRGIPCSFLPNNVAFRRDVFLKYFFDSRLRRSGAAHLLCQRLKAHGYRVVYEPNMLATHNNYGLAEEMRMRVKAGYDTVNLSTVDSERVLQEARYMKAGGPALFIVFLNRIIFDLRLLLRKRQDLGLSVRHVPYFLIASPIIRTVELVSGLITVVHPQYFKDKYGW